MLAQGSRARCLFVRAAFGRKRLCWAIIAFATLVSPVASHAASHVATGASSRAEVTETGNRIGPSAVGPTLERAVGSYQAAVSGGA